MDRRIDRHTFQRYYCAICARRASCDDAGGGIKLAGQDDEVDEDEESQERQGARIPFIEFDPFAIDFNTLVAW